MNARPESAPGAQLPAEFRSALELAQAAVWDWQLEEDSFQVDANWARAFGIDVSAAPMAAEEWKRRIHPDDLGAFLAATDSCQHGGDRFECEYRLLAGAHRWLWVLQRGRVVQRARDGAAVRITGLLLDIDRRKSEEVARGDSGATASRDSRPRSGVRARRSGSGTCPATRARRARCGSR